jgi:hypothetical protein
MTTRQILEIDESGRAMPDFVMGGQGYILRTRPRLSVHHPDRCLSYSNEPTPWEHVTYSRVKPRVR